MNSRDKAEQEFVKASSEYLRLLNQPPTGYLRGQPLNSAFQTPMDYDRAVENAKRRVDFWRDLIRDETEKLGTTDQMAGKKSNLVPTEKARRTFLSKYAFERRTFELFASRYLKNKDPLPTKADTIRAARGKHPDAYKEVPDKRMRAWLLQIYKELQLT